MTLISLPPVCEGQFTNRVLRHEMCKISLILFIKTWRCALLTSLIKLRDFLLNHHHQSVLPKGRYFTASTLILGCSSAEGRSSTPNSGTKAAVLPRIE